MLLPARLAHCWHQRMLAACQAVPLGPPVHACCLPSGFRLWHPVHAGCLPSAVPPPPALPRLPTCRWLVAFARALKAQLTDDSDLRAELEVGALMDGRPGRSMSVWL